MAGASRRLTLASETLFGGENALRMSPLRADFDHASGPLTNRFSSTNKKVDQTWAVSPTGRGGRQTPSLKTGSTS